MKYLTSLIIMMLLPLLAFSEDLELATADRATSLIPQSGKAVAQKDNRDLYQERSTVVAPEIAFPVELSSSDINRIACPNNLPIKDVVYSTEKGMIVKFNDSNAFVKFQIAMKNGQETFATKPVELYIICGNNIFNLIATPKRIPSQTIRLAGGKINNIKQNDSLMSGLPIEKKALMLIKLAYVDNLPDSFDITRPNKKFKIFKKMEMVLKRQVLVEGEGLQLKEFYVTNIGPETINLTEKDFMLSAITSNTLAVSLNKLSLNKGEVSRVFIVETNMTSMDGGGLSGYKK